MNLGAVIFMIRPYSYEIWAILRCMHHIYYYYSITDDAKTQKSLLEKFVSECLSYNQRRGSENKFPATFKRCLEIAKEVAITSGYAADLLCVRSDPYCGKRGAAASSSAQKVQDLEKEVKELRQWKQTMASRQPNQSYGQRQNRGRDSFMKPYGRATQQQSSYTHQQQASNYIQANQRSFNNIPAIQNQGQGLLSFIKLPATTGFGKSHKGETGTDLCYV